MIIAVDFDGTCVDHKYPAIGADVPEAVAYLRLIAGSGALLILWTMRSDGRPDGSNPLKDAVRWFEERRIPLWGVNINWDQKAWTDSPKVYANLYVDDAAFWCPLVEVPGGRPYADWSIIGPSVLEKIKALNAS